MTFDPTSILKDWGATLGILSVIAFLATLVLIFSLREFAFWFLRINQVMKKQDALMKRIGELEALLQKQNPGIVAGSAAGSAAATAPEPPPSKKKFPIAKAESSEGPDFQLLN